MGNKYMSRTSKKSSKAWRRDKMKIVISLANPKGECLVKYDNGGIDVIKPELYTYIKNLEAKLRRLTGEMKKKNVY